MKDQFGREINYLRVSVTDLCNLRCQYCMPAHGITPKLKHKDILTLEEIFYVVETCAQLGFDKVRITGGEPLVRKGIIGLISNISQLGISDLSMTTNGTYLLNYAADLADAGLQRVNISLDTLNKKRYREITRGGDLSKVLAGIKAAENNGLTPIKINTVLIGGFNDQEIGDFLNLTYDQPIDVRFIELMPIGQASAWAKSRFVSNQRILEGFPQLAPLNVEDSHSPAKYYKLPKAQGRVGLINPISHLFCMECNRIRLTADGKLKPCLHSNQEIDLKQIIYNNPAAILSKIIEGINAKQNQHMLTDHEFQPIYRNMNRIGG